MVQAIAKLPAKPSTVELSVAWTATSSPAVMAAVFSVFASIVCETELKVTAPSPAKEVTLVPRFAKATLPPTA